MKTILTACLLALAMGAQDQEKVSVLTADNVSMSVGSSAELVINMDYETTETVVGWNFSLYLPDGVSLLYDEEEEDYVYTVSSALHKKALRNSFKIIERPDGGYLLYCIDTGDLTPMTATKGELLRLTLVADATALDESMGQLKDIGLSNEANISLDNNRISDAEFWIRVEGGILSTGIDTIGQADDDADGYNTAGVRVGNNYHGLVIQKGRKHVGR